MINKDGATFYLNGNTWFRPAYGANGVDDVRLEQANQDVRPDIVGIFSGDALYATFHRQSHLVPSGLICVRNLGQLKD